MEIPEYERYGRQMIVPEIGLEGQLTLKNAKVLVIGAGGLGCPAIAYLAGAGIGTLGIVDPDTVETSNLHRQILHNTPGKYKAESAAEYVNKLNPNVNVRTWTVALTPANALEIVAQFDVVLDCTDSPMSRYLVNDACVLSGKPLVSASALKTEGQLAVYNYGENSPCYRCLFPVPPSPKLVGTCGDNGIIGPVVGIMGLHQAIEAIKVILKKEITPSLTLFSMFSFPQWRQMRIRNRKADCAIKGDAPSITSLENYDYTSFCGLSEQHQFKGRRINVEELEKHLTDPNQLLVDVRPAVQYNICSIPNSINWPIDQIRRHKRGDPLPIPGSEIVDNDDDNDNNNNNDNNNKNNNKSTKPITLICRYGNDSQEAASTLSEWGFDVCDVIGGLDRWSDLKPEFPRY